MMRTPLEALIRLVALIDHPSFEESIKQGEHLTALRESGEMEDARDTICLLADNTTSESVGRSRHDR